MYDPLGLSIGTTNLVAACHPTMAVVRRAVLTLYPHCAPKIGVFGEHSNETDPGTLMSGFVERIGDSVALVSLDGSTHDPDLLLVEALDAMVVAAGADSSSSEIAIAVPARWQPATVQALRDGLRTHIGFVRSGMAPCLVPDACAALTAVKSEVGLPDDGVVGLLDFGGSATYVTLVQINSDFEPLGTTMSYEDFSGNQIDQALLRHALDELGFGDYIDPANTAANGQLGQLRENCRAAKERLSTDTVTELVAELRGRSASIRLTRDQLEELIRDRLTGFIYAFDDVLARNNASFADLAAIVAVGGGADIPLVNQRLSFHARNPVLTASQPGCAAARGARLLAARGRELDFRTRSSVALSTAAAAGTSLVELPAGDVLVIDEEALTDRELAWSQTEFPSDMAAGRDGDSYHDDSPCWSMRLNVLEPPKEPAWRRFRVSQFLIGLSAVVAMTAIGGVAFTLTAVEKRQAPQTPMVPSVAPVPPRSMEPNSAAPSPAPPSRSAQPVPSAAPAPTSTAPPPPPKPSSTPVATTTQPPVTTTATTTAPPPATTSTTPATTSAPPTTTTATITTTTPTTTAPPTTTATTTTTPATVKMTTEWLHVPLLPIPIPVPHPKNLGGAAPPNSLQNAG